MLGLDRTSRKKHAAKRFVTKKRNFCISRTHPPRPHSRRRAYHTSLPPVHTVSVVAIYHDSGDYMLINTGTPLRSLWNIALSFRQLSNIQPSSHTSYRVAQSHTCRRTMARTRSGAGVDILPDAESVQTRGRKRTVRLAWCSLLLVFRVFRDAGE
jgi:hypothetical protein